MKKTEKPWGKTHLLQIIDVQNVLTFDGHASWIWTVFVSALPSIVHLSFSLTWNAFPAKLKPPAPSCVNEPSKLNPCPIVCYLLCAYQRARQRKHGDCQKKSCQGFWRLFGKGRMFGRPFFKTNPQELSTLCIYPRQLLNNTKNVSINKTLSVTNVTHHFYPATSEEHPMNNYDLNRTPFWKTCTGKKCIYFYTLDLG